MLHDLIVPLFGRLFQISDAVYRQVLNQTRTQHEAQVQACEVERPHLDATLRTNMDQIISSKEHVTGRMRGKSRLSKLSTTHRCS